MNIFYKRPLSLILCVLLGGFVFSSFGGTVARVITLSLASAIMIYATAVRLTKGARIRLLSFVALFILLGAFLSFLVFDVIYAPEVGDGVKVTGYITELDEKSDFSSVATVKTETVGDKDASTRITIHLSSKDTMYAHVGAKVSFTADLRPIKSTDDFDARSYYYSQGIYSAVEDYSELKYTGEKETGVRGTVVNLNDRISKHSILVMGEDAGALFAAVFMGNRNYISPSLSLDFKRIGITHILALSGMHLAILAAGLTRLLTVIGIRKKPRTVIIIVLTLGYMLLTGLSLSIVRAGLMVIISSLLYLLASAKDPLTNLAIAVTLICAIDPSAIFDFSLWLSALATLGIIALSELWSPSTYKKPLWARLLLWILVSLLSSFFAISATFAVTAAFSGTFSLLSAISTLIFSFLFEIFIYLGIVILLIGSVFPIGKAVMYPITWLITILSELMSRPSFVLLSSEAIYTRIAIALLTLSFFAFLVLKIKHKRIALAGVLSLFVLVYILGATDTYTSLKADDVLLASDGKHDVFIMKTDGDSMVIDVSTYNPYNAYDVVEQLEEQRIYSPDVYVITHYSYGLTSYLDKILSYIKVGNVLIPEPSSEDEEALLKMLYAALDGHGTKIITYQQEATVRLGEISFKPAYRVVYGEGTMKNAFEIEYKDCRIAYLGSGMLGYMTNELSLELIARCDTVVFGAHGNKYAPSYTFFLVYPDIERMIVLSDGLSLSNKATEKYKEKGTEILTEPGTVISLKH